MSSTQSLKERIQEDMKSSLRAQNKQRLDAVRLILAAIKQREVDERITLDDAMVLAILDKMLKQRRDSVEQFQKANRQDLIDQENFEIQIIQEYLPAQLSDSEILDHINEAIQTAAAVDIKDMGKVMNVLKAKLQGRVDMAIVSNKIKERLSGTK